MTLFGGETGEYFGGTCGYNEIAASKTPLFRSSRRESEAALEHSGNFLLRNLCVCIEK